MAQLVKRWSKPPRSGEDACKVVCDLCGDRVAPAHVHKAKLFKGVYNITQTTVDFEVDAQGDVDEVTTTETRAIPVSKAVWICRLCVGDARITLMDRPVPPVVHLDRPERRPHLTKTLLPAK